MAKKIIIALILLVSGFLLYVSLSPSHYKISREMKINSTPEMIFPHLHNAKKSNEWMPWAAMDPAMKVSYSGPEEGPGSTMSWESTGDMGIGQAIVAETTPNQMVKTRLVYKEPMEMEQMSQMDLMPTEGGTIVKWSVEGNSSFMEKFFSQFMDMDKMIGDNFIQGLTNLKSKVEAPTK